MASYKITIKNQTGGAQNYSYFCDRPVVSGGITGDLWSNVMKASPSTPNGGNSSFEVATRYFAIVGSFDGDAKHGGKVSVNKTVEIKLGSKDGANVSLGSSVALTVRDKASGDFSAATTPGQGKIGNFFVDTTANAPNTFTFQEAKNNNLFIGIASGKDDSVATAMGTFTPYPNARYQIMPAAIYYVAAGEKFAAGDLVKVEMIGASMAIDFNARQTNSVTLVHNENNQFEFV